MSLFNAPGSQLLGNFGLTSDAVLVSQAAFEPLFAYDAKFNLQPRLAQSWDLSADKRTYTIHLRPGVKWSDGQAFSAHDVEATILTMSDPKVVCPWTNYIDPIDGFADRKAGRRTDLPGVQVVDDRTIKITTTTPSSALPDLFATQFVVLPQHVLAKTPGDQLLKSAFAREPTVSTGPFHITHNVEGQYVELERNPNYWGPAPKLDRVFLKIMTPDTAIPAIEQGSLDVIPGGTAPDNVPPVDVANLKGNSAVTVTTFPFNTCEVIFLNDKTSFKDVRVRQALMYAIDRTKIVQQVLLGYAKVAYSAYAEYTPWYDPSLNKYEFDPGKAKQLLSEAGWKSGSALDFLVPSTDATVQNVATVIQQDLQAVGINTKIVLLDQATLVSRGQGKHQFDLAISNNFGFNNPDLRRRFATASYTTGINWGGYSNPELDRVLDEVVTKVTLAEQKPLTDRIQQIINQDVPVALLYYADGIGAVNTKRLGGATPSYLGIQRTMGGWFLK